MMIKKKQIIMSLFNNKSNKYHLGYALSGGGAKGFAHLGAIKVFESYGLHPDVIVGTSAGALSGALYADGYSPDEITELFKQKGLLEFFELTIPKSGIFNVTGLRKFLENNLRAKTFEDLKIPFMAVATDWQNAKTVVFSKGDLLIDAIIASCAVPVVINPIKINGIPFVDGGLLKNFPVSVIRQDCKYVIGVNVSRFTPLAEKPSIKNTAERTFNFMTNSNTIADRQMCDILVEAEGLNKYSMFDLNNIDTIKEIGYLCAVEAFLNEKALRIVKRCHRYDKLEEKVREKINKIKKQ